MKISDDLAQRIIDQAPFLENRFGIAIGASHPAGASCAVTDDFWIVLNATFSPESNSFENGQFYIVEANEFQIEFQGFGQRITADLEEKTEKIIDFLIDFEKWTADGIIKKKEFSDFQHYSWRPNGDGRFEVVEHHPTYKRSYVKHLDELTPVLAEHISQVLTLVIKAYGGTDG